MAELYRINNDNAKHANLNLGDLLVNYMAGDSVHKNDAQKFNGIDTNPSLKALLERSDFITERQKAGRILSLEGQVFWTLIIIDGVEYLKWFEVQRVNDKVFRQVRDIVVKSGKKFWFEKYNKSEDIFFRFYVNEDNRVVREGFIVDPSTKEIQPYKVNGEQDIFIYPPKYKNIVPGGVIKNNADGMPDWVKAGDILKEINAMSNDIGIEWEKNKTQFQNVGLFSNGTNGSTIAADIENGKWLHDTYSANSKFAQSLQPIIAGSTTIATLVQTIVFLEDRAMKYAFQGRDMDSSGTNKHNMQVGLFNQAHGEYNQVKKEQRERDYLYFFQNIVAEYIDGIVVNKVIIDSSIFEQGKIEGMKIAQEQRLLYSAQAENQKAQAQKNKEEIKNNSQTEE